MIRRTARTGKRLPRWPPPTMQENMKAMRGVGGRKGLKDDDMMKHHTMMENRMDRMLMMIEQMMQRDQMMQSMPSK